jgi:hypothetical protein
MRKKEPKKKTENERKQEYVR